MSFAFRIRTNHCLPSDCEELQPPFRNLTVFCIALKSLVPISSFEGRPWPNWLLFTEICAIQLVLKRRIRCLFPSSCLESVKLISWCIISGFNQEQLPNQFAFFFIQTKKPIGIPSIHKTRKKLFSMWSRWVITSLLLHATTNEPLY